MSLNINMKDVKLVKDDDSWVYISKDGIEKTTKLLYDDGKTAEEIYKKTFTDFSVKGRYEELEDYMGTYDFIKSVGKAFCGKKADDVAGTADLMM